MSVANNERSGITLTYSGPDVLLDSPAFGQLLSAFSSHLPLRNLHWKPSAAQNTFQSPASPLSPATTQPQTASIRTIQTLNTRLEPLSDTLLRSKLKPETRHLVQRSLLERPFCHLYFVVGDDSDAYRSHIRNDIRAWLGTIQGTPILSAATITSRAFQVSDVTNANGSSTPRSATPPVRPDTPTRSSLSTSDEVAAANPASSSKEKLPPTSPEYLIVVITPNDAASLALPSSGSAGRAASPISPATGTSTPTSEAPKTGLQRFYSSSSSKDSPSASSSKGGGVVEKVKADFNTSRKERVIALNRLPSLTLTNDDKANRRNHSDPTIFAELTSRIKESVASTFDAVVGMQDEAVRKELAKKDVPGWNYNKWAAGMECLASTFESAGLFSDALAHYEEIESVFLDCLAEKKLPYFNRVGATDSGDDSALLLDLSKKDYRDLILRNDISLFDFRCYLFARRAHLLAKMGRISQVMSETPPFLSGITQLLQSETLAAHFIESWTYSTSIDVVEQCQAWLIERGDVKTPGLDKDEVSQATLKAMADRIADSQLSASFHAAKAELLDLARRQLDRIGISVGHLPRAMPFSLSLSSDDDDVKNKSSTSTRISRQELVELLNNREVFDLRYTALAERVLGGWVSCGRRRNVLRLRCVLASVDYFRARYLSANKTFTTISEPYAESEWRSVEAIQLARQLVCHDELKMARDKTWVNIVLALLRTQGSWDACDVEKDSSDAANTYLNEEKLYTMLRTESKNSETEIPISRSAGIEVIVKSQKASLNTEGDANAFTIVASVESKARHAISVDDVRVCLVNGSQGEVWFTSGRLTLQPGVNDVRTSCVGTCQSGKFVLELTQVRLGKVIFQNVLHASSNVQTTKSFQAPTFINVPENGDALEFALDWAPHVFLDRSRTGVITIFTGRNALSELRLRVQLSHGEKLIRGQAEAAFHIPAQGPQSARMTADADGVTLTKLAARTQYLVLLPFHEVQGIADGVLQVNISADYRSDGMDSTASMKSLVRTAKLSLGLPLGVNVQDFFRHDRLLSKFLISAGAAGPLRLADVDLWSEEEAEKSAYKIQSPSLQAPYTISVDMPSSFVFAIRKANGKRDKLTASSSSSALRLTLVYRTAHEEAVDVLLRAVDELGAQKDWMTDGLKRNVKRSLNKHSFANVHQERYAEDGQVHFLPFHPFTWQTLCTQWCEVRGADDVERLVVFVKDVFGRAEELSKEESMQTIPKEALDVEAEIAWLQEGRKPWRKLSLPVDVPTMTLINAVQVKLSTATDSIRVGEPVEAHITIESSFAWTDFAAFDDDDDDENDAAAPPNEEAQDDDDFADAQSDISTDERKNANAAGGADDRSGEKLFVSVDVNCDFVNWLLSGAKRKTITLPSPRTLKASREARSAVYSNSISMTLVALQSGQLSLPTVSIWPLTEPLLERTPGSQAHIRAAEQEVASTQAKPSYLANITSDTFIVNEAETVRVLPRHSVPISETFWVTS